MNISPRYNKFFETRGKIRRTLNNAVPYADLQQLWLGNLEMKDGKDKGLFSALMDQVYERDYDNAKTKAFWVRNMSEVPLPEITKIYQRDIMVYMEVDYDAILIKVSGQEVPSNLLTTKEKMIDRIKERMAEYPEIEREFLLKKVPMHETAQAYIQAHREAMTRKPLGDFDMIQIYVGPGETHYATE